MTVREAVESGLPLRGNLQHTSRAASAVDQAHVRAAMDDVEWERRGLLQRLRRRRRKD
jgi:hypothetical protein